MMTATTAVVVTCLKCLRWHCRNLWSKYVVTDVDTLLLLLLLLPPPLLFHLLMIAPFCPLILPILPGWLPSLPHTVHSLGSYELVFERCVCLSAPSFFSFCFPSSDTNHLLVIASACVCVLVFAVVANNNRNWVWVWVCGPIGSKAEAACAHCGWMSSPKLIQSSWAASGGGGGGGGRSAHFLTNWRASKTARKTKRHIFAYEGGGREKKWGTTERRPPLFPLAIDRLPLPEL